MKIPTSVTRIGIDVFRNNNLIEVIIPQLLVYKCFSFDENVTRITIKIYYEIYLTL